MLQLLLDSLAGVPFVTTAFTKHEFGALYVEPIVLHRIELNRAALCAELNFIIVGVDYGFISKRLTHLAHLFGLTA